MADEAAAGPSTTQLPSAPPPSPVSPGRESTSSASSTPSASAQADVSANPFRPDSILGECVVNQGFGSVFESGTFESRFAGTTVEFTGTVARINAAEGLVVFHGGGTYPRNWDLQLKRGDFSFSAGSSYHVVFRLQSVKAIPLSGYSFRGKVISKSRD
jgi:hypothetical protein